MAPSRIVVVGAGVFGVTAAIELARRGHRVRLLDPGPLPHPLAASTDISKLVRMDYGSDDDYTRLAMEAIPIWREWNETLGPFFHETGILFLTEAPLEERPFERESFERASRLGLRPDRLSREAIRARFPAFSERYVDGYFNPAGGWTSSGRVVSALAARARDTGVELHEGVAFERLLERGARVFGVRAADGTEHEADVVLVAAGQWTPHLLPFTKPFFRSDGMPVWWLRPAPEDAALFTPPRLTGFCADITATGWYGFPLHPEEGVVKVANHGPGREMHPESPERVVLPEETAALRAFLAGALPALAAAPIVHTRVCLYCDTWDGHFWIDHDPEREGLVLATGGSGHGLKFAPVLGALIADIVEREPNPYAKKFRWRPELREARNEEEARHKEDAPR